MYMAKRDIHPWNTRITGSLFPFHLMERNNGFWRLSIQHSNQAYQIETPMNKWDIHGLAYVYNGKHKKILSFQNGTASGPCKLYDSEGKLWFKGTLEDGYRQWKGTEYDEFGKVLFDGFYEKGERIETIVPLKEMPGFWTEYDKDGRLISVTGRDDYGRNEGICYFYDEKGEINRISEWKEGKEMSDTGYCEIFDEPRRIWYKGRYEKGTFQGRGVENDEDGNTRFNGFYDHGKKVERIVPLKEMPGYWKEYDEGGRLISITQRDDICRIEGICYFYDEKGEISRISEWREGIEKSYIGRCTIFDEPRRIWYDGHFENSNRQYRGTEYDESGNVIFDGFYNKGERIETIVPLKEMPGFWTEYDKDGRLISVTGRDDYGRNEGICYFYDEKGEINRISEWKEGKEMSDTGYCEIYDIPRKNWYKGHFEKGKRLTKTPYKGKKGYWQECNEDNQLFAIYGQDKEEKREGVCYFYSNGSISRISFLSHGKEVKLIKQFNGSAMEEFYENGQKCYEGGFLDSFELDYPRNGDGEEYYPDGKTLLFKGSYNNGRKHGKGRSYKNNEINGKTVWLAGYSKEGLLLTLLAVIAMFIASLLIDVILGLVFLVIAILLIIIRWSCSKLLGNSICNRTDLKLMADYFRDEHSKSTKTGKGTKRILRCFFGNIYFSVIFFVFLLLICLCTSAHFYYNAVNTYVSVFQTTYTAKSFRNNNIAGFRLSFKPFLKTIEIENQCFEVASVF